MILGFEYQCGLHTTTGERNARTGRYNVAGQLVAFKTHEDREIWLSNWARNRIPCTKRQARALFLGLSLRDFEEMINLTVEFPM